MRFTLRILKTSRRRASCLLHYCCTVKWYDAPRPSLRFPLFNYFITDTITKSYMRTRFVGYGPFTLARTMCIVRKQRIYHICIYIYIFIYVLHTTSLIPFFLLINGLLSSNRFSRERYMRKNPLPLFCFVLVELF